MQDSRGGLLDALAGFLDLTDGLLAASGPGCDVAEGVVAAFDPERLAYDICRGLCFQFCKRPVLEVLVQQGVRDLVGERLYALGGGVAGLDSDAVLAVVAVAVGGAAELVVFDAKADRPGDGEERRVVPGRVVAGKAFADGGELFAVGLGDVEHGDELEAPDYLLGLSFLGPNVLVDHGGEDPDGRLSLADEAVQLPPGVEACHLSCFVALSSDEQHVVERVTVELRLEVEVALPLLGRGEVPYPFC